MVDTNSALAPSMGDEAPPNIPRSESPDALDSTSPNGHLDVSRESSYPPTPSGAIHFTPRRAMTSFENLVALANHQERLREARKMVWRDRGEPVVELQDVRACAEHALTGGLRSGTLAFSIRASFNLVLALIRIRSVPKKYRLALLGRAIFGTDTWRFAAMLGTFVSTYKFLLNALPLLAPFIKPALEDRPRTFASPFADDDEEIDLEAAKPRFTQDHDRRTARLSLSAHAQEALVRKRTRRWHAAFAGAVAGGLAILCEKKGRRGVIAQQLFVRGLQGSYNAFSEKKGIHVPHGDVLVFAFASGQILYAWLMRPDTLPRSYTTWVGHASKVPSDAIRMNLNIVRNQTFDTADLDKLVARSDITSANSSALLAFKDTFFSPTPGSYIHQYAPCSAIHPGQTSCLSVPADRFVAVFKWMLPIYGALHFVPAVLFKRKLFVKDPLKMLLKAAWGTGRSSAFLGVFVIIYQSLNCFNHQLHEYLSMLPTSSPFKINQKVLDTLLISKGSFWLPGFLAGMSLFVEEKRRRPELAMYVLPKALESAWVIGRGKVGLLNRWKGGEGMLTALGMAMVMSTYQNDPQHLSGLVRRVLYQFIGPN